MRDIEYNNNGMLQRVLIPDDAPESHAQYGILIGPPSLDSLNLPEELKIRLNNELYHRRIFTKSDSRKRITEVAASVMAAVKVDAQRILECYGLP